MNVTSLPLSLYIHFPWCVRKCGYCDFNSYAIDTKVMEKEYLRALLRDLRGELSKIANRQISSIFIGGGTPSCRWAKPIIGVIAIWADIVCRSIGADIAGKSEQHQGREYAVSCETYSHAQPFTAAKYSRRHKDS